MIRTEDQWARPSNSDFHAKFAKSLFLLSFECAFDCSVIKLAAHLVKVSVRVQSFNRQVQTGDSVRYSFRSALERLLYRIELISESKCRDRMPRINLKKRSSNSLRLA